MKVRKILYNNGQGLLCFEVLKDWTFTSNRYRLLDDVHYATKLRPSSRIDVNSYISLTENGVLTIRAGYVWDGPSGPTIDTDSFMFGSIVHDALYQCLRSGKFVSQGVYWDHDRCQVNRIPHDQLRHYADKVIRDICMNEGMFYPRYCWVYEGLRIGGAKHAAIGSRWRGDRSN